MELDRRARKVMEANARRASYVAVISDAASLFSAVEVVISSAVAYFGHPRGDWPLPIRPLGRLVVVMPQSSVPLAVERMYNRFKKNAP